MKAVGATPNRTSASRRLVFLAVSAALVLGAAACSSEKKSEATDKSEKRAEKALAACKGVDTKKRSKITNECADAIFIAAIARADSDELYQLDDARLLTIGRGACDYAAQLVADPTQAPNFDAMVDFNSKNWKLSEAATRKIMALSEDLCPDDMAAMLKLTKDQGEVKLTFQVSATGPVQVSYTGTSKDVADKAVKSPWKAEVKLNKPANVELTAFPSDGTAESTCTIKLGAKTLASARAKAGEMAICRITEGEVAAEAAGMTPAD